MQEYLVIRKPDRKRKLNIRLKVSFVNGNEGVDDAFDAHLLLGSVSNWLPLV